MTRNQIDILLVILKSQLEIESNVLNEIQKNSSKELPVDMGFHFTLQELIYTSKIEEIKRQIKQWKNILNQK